MKSIVLMLLVISSSTASAARANSTVHSAPQWTLQHSPTTADLADISCATTTQCVAVGANATMVATKDGGVNWSRLSSPFGIAHPSASFVSVRCPASGVCSVLAAPNVVLHTTNGGHTWTKRSIPLTSQLSGLGRLACPTRNECFVTATPTGNPETWFDHSAAVFKTADGNTSWQRLSIPPSIPCPGDCSQPTVGFELQWLSCQSGQSCRAGGDTFIGSHEGYSSVVIRTNDGGTTWKLVHHSFDPSIATCATASLCTGVYYEPLTPNIGPNLLRSTDGGATWTTAPLSTVLTSIACTGKAFCELAGPGGNLAMTNAAHPFVQKSPTTQDLHAVACPRSGACYAVGAGGTILTRGS